MYELYIVVDKEKNISENNMKEILNSFVEINSINVFYERPIITFGSDIQGVNTFMIRCNIENLEIFEKELNNIDEIIRYVVVELGENYD